jgi:long-chain fatty acid transport protein
MHTLRSTLFSALGVAALASTASANGFFINEHDAKVTGRAGAATASDTDPSAIVFNPGGIAIGDGTRVSIGGALIVAKGTYTDTNDNSTDTDSGPAVVPQLFVTSKLTDMVAVGIGFHAPFGLALSWPDDSPQADVSTDSALRTYFITPSVGLDLKKQVPGLSVGAGIDLVPATVELKQRLFFGDPMAGGATGEAKLGGQAFGIGARVGVMYHPPSVEALKLGAMYRSPVTLDFEGSGDFDMPDPFRSQLPPDGDISTTLHLPQAVAVGAAYSVMPQLEFEANVVWQGWSTFETIDITLPDGSHQVAPQNYEDTFTFRVGAEYKLPEQHAAIRAGYIYDPTPIPSTTISARLPDANRNDITLGGSYSFGNYDISLGLLAVLPSKQEASDQLYMPVYKGEYKVSAFVASLGFIGKFGK